MQALHITMTVIVNILYDRCDYLIHGNTIVYEYLGKLDAPYSWLTHQIPVIILFCNQGTHSDVARLDLLQVVVVALLEWEGSYYNRNLNVGRFLLRSYFELGDNSHSCIIIIPIRLRF